MQLMVHEHGVVQVRPFGRGGIPLSSPAAHVPRHGTSEPVNAMLPSTTTVIRASGSSAIVRIRARKYREQSLQPVSAERMSSECTTEKVNGFSRGVNP